MQKYFDLILGFSFRFTKAQQYQTFFYQIKRYKFSPVYFKAYSNRISEMKFFNNEKKWQNYEFYECKLLRWICGIRKTKKKAKKTINFNIYLILTLSRQTRQERQFVNLYRINHRLWFHFWEEFLLVVWLSVLWGNFNSFFFLEPKKHQKQDITRKLRHKKQQKKNC